MQWRRSGGVGGRGTLQPSRSLAPPVPPSGKDVLVIRISTTHQAVQKIRVTTPKLDDNIKNDNIKSNER